MLVGASPAAAATPIPVLHSRASELQPAVATGLLAWTQAPSAHPNRYAAYARSDGKHRFRLNPRGTLGFTASGAIDGMTIVYQQRRSFNGPGNMKLFDLATHKRRDPPPGVNTRRHEKGGALFGDWLLFTRESSSRDQVILFNLVTREARQLDVARGNASFGSGGSLRGSYAAWAKCRRPSRCQTYVYDIASRAKLRVPNPRHRSQYAVSVTSAGVVYFAESRNINCGREVGLWRYPLGGARTRLLSLSGGHDLSTTSPVVDSSGTTSLFYDRFVCRTNRSDVFKLKLAP